MTSRLLMSKKDPRRADFLLVGDPALGPSTPVPAYSADTTHYARPRNGCRATTTVTRTDHGDRLQVGVIEWPVLPRDPTILVVGTREVNMSSSGIFTSSERFTAADGYVYEWQIQDACPLLVPLRSHARTSPSYVATFVQSKSGFWLLRKHTSSLFIPPEGFHILDDIVVTFIYFQGKWRDKEGVRSRSSLSGGIMQ